MEEIEMQKNRNWTLSLPFQILSISFLSLLLPLSFLFLSRLSLFSYHLLTTSFSPNHILHHITLSVIYTFISSILAATLFRSLSGKTECSVLRSRLYLCWILLYIYLTVLFLLQACLIELEGATSANFDTRSFLAVQERWVSIRILFFLGLHEGMLTWFRVVVKPVVDDTIFGLYSEEERWPERASVDVTFGAMWWWRLQELAVVEELKRKLLIGLEASDFVNWWIYYLCVVIGMIKVLGGFLWVCKKVLTCKRPTRVLSLVYLFIIIIIIMYKIRWTN